MRGLRALARELPNYHCSHVEATRPGEVGTLCVNAFTCWSVPPNWSCPTGYQFDNLARDCRSTGSAASCPVATPPYTLDAGGPTCSRPGSRASPTNWGKPLLCAGNPINPGTGNKYQAESIYTGSGPFPLELTLSYNSAGAPSAGNWGARWWGTHDRAIRSSGPTQPTAAIRPDGRIVYFRPVGGIWTPDSDVTDRLAALTDGGGHFTGWVYKTSEDEVETYDARGKLVSIADRAGRRQTFAYGGTGRLSSVTDPFGRALNFSYDAQNRIATVTDPAGKAYAFAYDSNSNLSSITFPDNAQRTYRYEDTRFPNALTGIIDENGSRFATWAYDAEGRAVLSEHAGGEIRYAYDQGSNALGRLTTMVQDSGYPLIQWTYDARGRVETETLMDLRSPGAPLLTLRQGFVYDGAGRLAERIYPSGQKVSYTYDAGGRVASIAYGGTPVLHGITYQPFGSASGWILGNGTRYERRFDTDGRMVSYPIGSDIHHLSYDAASRITRISHERLEASGLRSPRPSSRTHHAFEQHFDYDRLDRLVRSVDGRESRVYRYDANGNRLGQSLNGERYVHSVSANSNHLLSITGRSVRTFRYDAAGNTLSDDVASFTYNAQGRMASATVGNITTTYLYNGKGERIAKKGRHVRGGMIYFAYDEFGRLIGEYDAQARPIQEIIYLEQVPVALARNDAVYYIHADHLGTPRAITNTRDKVVWRWDSDAFGAAAPDEHSERDRNSFVFNLRFPGQYYDKETNLHYNYYRDYDPSTGRYVQSDPIGLAGGLNAYAYVDGNPVNYVDPKGEIPIVPIAIGIALVAGSQSTSLHNAAAEAAEYWARVQVRTGNWGYGIPGAIATLADPCNASTTSAVLGVGAALGAYLGRPFWQYYPAGDSGYASPWTTRGWGWNPPYQPGTEAAQKLGLPPWNPGTAVRPVVPSASQFVGGASRVGPYANPLYPGYAQSGGGIQYTIGRWPAGTSNWIPWAF